VRDFRDMTKIIISYRRADTQDMAMRIRDRLADYFGKKSVLTDIDSIPIGSDFLAYINTEISTCDVLLAVVGPRWLRIDNESDGDAVDYVRLEIETAFKQQVRVVPVTVSGGRMPKPSELPESISAFALRNAAAVDSGLNFQNDMDRLIRSLHEYIATKQERTDLSAAEPIPIGTRSRMLVSPDPASAKSTVLPKTGLMRFVSAFDGARRSVPAVDFALGASVVAILAALVMGFAGYARASLVIFIAMLLALVLVTASALLMSHRNATLAKVGLVSIWVAASLFIGFLGASATAIGFKWPTDLAAFMGLEVEDPICAEPLANQEAFTCNGGGDWVVVGIPLNDSDRVTLTIRDKPDGAQLAHIPANATDASVGQCEENWCRIQCARVSGVARQKYLSPRTSQLHGVLANVSGGAVGVRAGPHRSCRARITVSPDRNVILHGCERSPSDQTEWCRVTYNGVSGWIPQAQLDLSK
jgi:SH3-like domain-containing protein